MGIEERKDNPVVKPGDPLYVGSGYGEVTPGFPEYADTGTEATEPIAIIDELMSDIKLKLEVFKGDSELDAFLVFVEEFSKIVKNRIESKYDEAERTVEMIPPRTYLKSVRDVLVKMGKIKDKKSADFIDARRELLDYQVIIKKMLHSFYKEINKEETEGDN